MHDELLLSVLADVVNGFSVCIIRGKTAFIKHLDLRTELKASATYKRYFLKYKESGLPTREDRLSFLKEEGDWTDQDESFVNKQSRFLENLLKTKDKLVLSSQMAEIEKTIKETRFKIEEKILLRERLIGATCEKYANKRKEEDQILRSVFSDEELTERFISEEDAEYAGMDELQDIFDQYFKIFSEFSDSTLKKIAVMPLFYNFFSLAPKDDLASVFGKTPVEMTFFQQRLLHLAQNIRYIYENVPNIPEDIRGDYDKLIDFSRKDRDGSRGDKGNAGYSMVGAKKKEMKDAGIKTENTISPFDMLKKSGKKSLSKGDFLNQVE